MDNLSTGYSALNLPFSPEAEQSVLGAILLDSSCLDRVAEILPRPDYFYPVSYTHLDVYKRQSIPRTRDCRYRNI